MPRNTTKITLRKEPWTLPAEYPLGEHSIIPLKAGETLQWKVISA